MNGYPITWTPEQERDIRQLYTSGKSLTAIGKIYGVSYSSMWRLCDRMGLECRDGNRQYTIDEHIFDVIDTQEKAYWLGFIWADGCVYRKVLSVALQIRDGHHLQGLATLLGSDKPVRERHYDFDKAEFTANSVYLTNRLQELGILKGRPDHHLMLDQILDHLLGAWTRGFFDGDGCASATAHSVGFCGSAPFLHHLRELLSRHTGTNPSISVYKNTQSDYYSVVYKGYYNAHKITDWMYQDATVFLARKHDIIASWPEPNRSRQTSLGWATRYQKYSRDEIAEQGSRSWVTRRHNLAMVSSNH